MSADIESSTDSGSIKHDHANSPSYPHDRIGLFISSSMRDEEDRRTFPGLRIAMSLISC